MEYTIRLSYAVLNVFQQYWLGQGDPLYAVLSRRGISLDQVEQEMSLEEVEALVRVAQEIRDSSDREAYRRTANLLLGQIEQRYQGEFEIEHNPHTGETIRC